MITKPGTLIITNKEITVEGFFFTTDEKLKLDAQADVIDWAIEQLEKAKQELSTPKDETVMAATRNTIWTWIRQF